MREVTPKTCTSCGDTVKSRYPLACFCLFVFIRCVAAQTYDVNGPSGGTAPPAQKQGSDTSNSQNNSTQTDSNLGWGSSIDVARQARAAQGALDRNDYTAAVAYAERAAKSAPQNPELWFLLGYAARLEDHYTASIDAYKRGLKLQPNSVRGMAGLGQTYAKMGRIDEAEELLQKVVDANPKDANSLQLAGELLLNTDTQKALDLLQRAEAVAPTAHTDLLLAHAYDHLCQADESDKYCNRARNRAPKDPEVLRAVAGQYRDQGKYDEAIAALQAIPEKTIDVQADLAYTYQLAGKSQEAAALYIRLAKSAKGNLGLNLSAAQALVALGQG